MKILQIKSDGVGGWTHANEQDALIVDHIAAGSLEEMRILAGAHGFEIKIDGEVKSE